MQFDAGEKELKSDAVPKVRIGSRVPDESLDWLKRHGIVTDQIPPEQKKFKKKFFSPHFIILVLGVWVLLSAWIIVQQHYDAGEALKQSSLRLQSMEFSNQHLLARLERLSELGKVQQFEINRLTFEAENIRWNLGKQIRSLEKQVELERALGTARDAVEF